MRHLPMLLGLVLWLCASPLAAGETYDLLFKSAALDGLRQATDADPDAAALSYDRLITGTAAAEPGEYRLDLRLAADDTAVLSLHQGTLARAIGSFPAAVGNPVIMYFMETTLRDMAQTAGGSPFYIRNRMKDALLREAEITPVTVTFAGQQIAARQITLRPFTQDAARDRMGGFAELALVVTVSEDVPGWYYSLTATAPTAAASSDVGYSNTIALAAAAGAGE